MPLGLVLLQHRLDLRVERPVIQRQTLRKVLMHRGLADPEFFGGGADGRPVFYEVKGQLLGPLFQILSDRAPLLTVGWSIYMPCREQLCPQKRAGPHTQKVCGRM